MDSILTKGSPIKGIILFSIPLLLGNIFQQIYTLSDTLIAVSYTHLTLPTILLV